MIAALTLLSTPAYACDWADDLAVHDGAHDKCGDVGAPPAVVVRTYDDDDRSEDDDRRDDKRRSETELRYGMQFLPNAPAHHGYARFIGKKDAYIGAEVRYLPSSEMLWTGRVGAGFDVLGGDGLDFTLGLWLGSAGQWDRDQGRAVVYASPVAGTEIGLGADLGRIFGKYRWIGGFGGGPIDALLTENELTLGFELVEGLEIFGQFLNLNPGEEPSRNGLGLGVQAVL